MDWYQIYSLTTACLLLLVFVLLLLLCLGRGDDGKTGSSDPEFEGVGASYSSFEPVKNSYSTHVYTRVGKGAEPSQVQKDDDDDDYASIIPRRIEGGKVIVEAVIYDVPRPQRREYTYDVPRSHEEEPKYENVGVRSSKQRFSDRQTPSPEPNSSAPCYQNITCHQSPSLAPLLPRVAMPAKPLPKDTNFLNVISFPSTSALTREPSRGYDHLPARTK